MPQNDERELVPKRSLLDANGEFLYDDMSSDKSLRGVDFASDQTVLPASPRSTFVSTASTGTCA